MVDKKSDKGEVKKEKSSEKGKSDESVLEDKSSEKEEGEKVVDKKIGGGYKEIYLVLGVIFLMGVVFFVSYSIFNGLNEFEHKGLTFTKEKFGEIPIYHHYYYYNSYGQLYKYNLYLRNDPRKSTVPLTGNVIDIVSLLDKDTVYLSLDPERSIEGCEYAAVGISSLSSFLVDNGLNLKGASTSKEEAEANGVKHITCEGVNSGNIAIILRTGSETRIINEKENCYVIEVSNCEVIDAIEKFEVESIVNTKANQN